MWRRIWCCWTIPLRVCRLLVVVDYSIFFPGCSSYNRGPRVSTSSESLEHGSTWCTGCIRSSVVVPRWAPAAVDCGVGGWLFDHHHLVDDEHHYCCLWLCRPRVVAPGVLIPTQVYVGKPTLDKIQQRRCEKRAAFGYTGCPGVAFGLTREHWPSIGSP